MAEERKVQLGFAVDADGVKPGLNEIKQDVREMARDVEQSGKRAGEGLGRLGEGLKKTGDGAPEATRKVDGATRSIIGSIERATAAMKAGEKGSAAYFEALGRQRGVSADVLRPYIEQLREAERAQREAKTAMDSMGQSAKSTSESFAGLARTGIQAFLGSALLKATKDVGAAMFEASAQAERFRTTLNFATGGRGTQEIDYLRRVTNELGLAFNSTAQAYSGFQAAARGTALEGQKAKDVFESIAKASAVMGLSAEQSGGVLLALQQMISKGTVQAEELRGQLGERLPGAFQIAAKAMGVTTAELGKMLEQGQVVASDFLPKFARALNDTLGGETEKAADRLDAAVNRFANAWERLKQAGGDSGVSKAMANEMNALTRDVSAVTETMENAAKAGQGMFAQLASAAAVGAGRMAFSTLNLAANTLNGTINALTGDILGLNTKMAILPDAFKTNAEQAAIMGREVEVAQAKLKRLQELDAMPANGNYFKSAIAQTQAYIAKLQEAIRLRDAAGGEKSDPRDIPATMTRGASYARWAQEQKESEQKMLEIRMRQSGVNKQYLQELKDLEEAKARLVITDTEYRERVSALAKTTWDASIAGKDAARTARETAKAAKESGDAFAAQRDAAKTWASTLQKAEQGIAGVENKTLGLNAAQAALVEYLTSPAYQINAESQRQLALNTLYAWDAALKHADAVKEEKAAIEAADKAIGAWTAARQKDADTLDSQLQAMRDEIDAIGMTSEAVAELTAKKHELAAATEEEYAANLRAASAYAGEYKDAYEQAARDAAERARKLREKAGLERTRGEKKAAKEAEDAWQKSADQINQSLTDALLRGFESGKGFAENLRDTLKNMFNTLVLRPIISAVMQPVSMVINGVTQSALSAMGLGGNGGGILGMASNASTLNSGYNFLTGGGNLGAMVFGNPYAYSMGVPGLTMGSQQAAMLAAQTGEFGWAGLSATSSAGSGAAGGAAGAGWAAAGVAAVAALIANAAGLFRSDRPVGGGLMGTFGKGDIRPYELWREGGTLFSGPNYSINDRGGELERSRDTLKTLMDGGEGGSQMAAFLQQRIEFLEKTYGATLEGAEAQGKALDAAFVAMRTHTLKFGEVLGISTDRLKDWTTTVGTDLIHPDTGGLGIDLTDLDQAGVAKKITEALATANNELAEQIIGSWVTTTEVVKRAVETISPSGGEDGTPGQWDVLEETITRTTYVQSEYAREGEKAIDTLTRLATSLSGANAMFDMLGYAAYEASLKGGDMASHLSDLFGGMEAMAAAAGDYFKGYYSASEQTAYMRAGLQKALDTVDLKLPAIDTADARGAFRGLVESLDLTTEEGRKAYAVLLQSAGAFAQLAEAEAQLKAVREALSAQLGATTELTNGYVAALAQAAGGMDKLTGKAQNYYSKFFTEEERNARLIEQTRQQLSALGYEMPTTAEGFRSLVDAALAMGDAGTSLVAALLDAADGVYALTGAAQKLAQVSSPHGDGSRDVSVTWWMDQQEDAFGRAAQARQRAQELLAEGSAPKLSGVQERLKAIQDEANAVRDPDSADRRLVREYDERLKKAFERREAAIASGDESEMARAVDAYWRAYFDNSQYIDWARKAIAELDSAADELAAAQKSLLAGELMGDIRAQIDALQKGQDGPLTAIKTAIQQYLDDLQALGALTDDNRGLVDRLGGLQLDKARKSLYDQLLGKDELREQGKADLQKQFAGLGQALPGTTEALRKMIDAAQAAGNTTLADKLLELVPAFVALQGAADGLQSALQDASKKAQDAARAAADALAARLSAGSLLDRIDQARGGKGDRYSRLREAELWGAMQKADYRQQIEMAGELTDIVLSRYQAEKQAAEQQLSFAKNLKDYIASLSIGNLSPKTLGEKLAEANRQYQDTLGLAQGGDEQAQGRLQGAANAYLDLARQYYASSGDYTAIFEGVTGSLSGLSGALMSDAERQLSVSSASLDELQKLTGVLEGAYAKAGADYEAQKTLLEQQLTALRGIEGGAEAVKDIIASLPATLAASLQTQAGAAAEAIQMALDTPVKVSPGGEDIPTVITTPAPIDWTEYSRGNEALVEEIKALRAEVVQLREERRAADGQAIEAEASIAQQNAERVVQGVGEAVRQGAYQASLTQGAIYK